MPFFLHLRSDFPFKTLEQCITPENPDRYPVSITADDYLQERLREIGLKKAPASNDKSAGRLPSRAFSCHPFLRARSLMKAPQAGSEAHADREDSGAAGNALASQTAVLDQKLAEDRQP
jgi:hypothetical protein